MADFEIKPEFNEENQETKEKRGIYGKLEDGWYSLMEKLHLTGLVDAIDKFVPSFALFLIFLIILVIGLSAVLYFTFANSGKDVLFTFHESLSAGPILDDLNIRFDYAGTSEFFIVSSEGQKIRFNNSDASITIQNYTDGYSKEQKTYTVEKTDTWNKVILEKDQPIILENTKVSIKVLNSDMTPFTDQVSVKMKCVALNREEALPVTQNAEYTKPANCGTILASSSPLGFIPIIDLACPNDICELILRRNGNNPEPLPQPMKNTLVVRIFDSLGNSTAGKQLTVTLAKGSILSVLRDENTTMGATSFSDLDVGQYFISVIEPATGATALKQVDLVAGNPVTVDLNLSSVVSGRGINVNLRSEDRNACVANLLVYDDDRNILSTQQVNCGTTTHLAINDNNYYYVTIVPSGDYKLIYDTYDSGKIRLTVTEPQLILDATLENFDVKNFKLVKINVEDEAGALKNVDDLIVEVKSSEGRLKGSEEIDANGVAEFILKAGEYFASVDNTYLTNEGTDFEVETPRDNNSGKLQVQNVELLVEWKLADIILNIVDMGVCLDTEEDCELEPGNIRVDLFREGITDIDWPSNECDESGCGFEGVQAGQYLQITVTAGQSRIPYISPKYFLEGGKTYNIDAKLYKSSQFSASNFSVLTGISGFVDCNNVQEIVSQGDYYYCVDVLISGNQINNKVVLDYAGKDATIKQVYAAGSNSSSDSSVIYNTTDTFVSTIVFAVSVSAPPRTYSMDVKRFVGVELTNVNNEEGSEEVVNFNQRLLCSTTNYCLDVFAYNVLQPIANVYVPETQPVYLRVYKAGDLFENIKLFGAGEYNFAKSGTQPFNFDGNTKGYNGSNFYDVSSRDKNYLFLQRSGNVVYAGLEFKDVKFSINNTNLPQIHFVNKNQFNVIGLPLAIGLDYNTPLHFAIVDFNGANKISGDINIEVAQGSGVFNATSNKISLSSRTGEYDVNFVAVTSGEITFVFKKAGYVTRTIKIISNNRGFYEAPINYIVIPVPAYTNVTTDFKTTIDLNIRNLTNQNIVVDNCYFEYDLLTQLSTYATNPNLYFDENKYLFILNRGNGQSLDKISATCSNLMYDSENIDLNIIIKKEIINKLKDSSANYISLPTRLFFVGSNGLKFVVPVLLQFKPQIEQSEVFSCDDINIYFEKDQNKVDSVYIDLNNPNYTGNLRIENNNINPKCLINDENVLGYDIIVGAFLNKWSDSNINVKILNTDKLLKTTTGTVFYETYRLNKGQISETNKIPVEINTTLSQNYVSGKLAFEVRPVFKHNKTKNMLGEGKIKQTYFSGYNLNAENENRFLLTYVFNQVLNVVDLSESFSLILAQAIPNFDENHEYYIPFNRPSVYSTNFFAGDIAACLKINYSGQGRLDFVRYNSSDNRFIRVFNRDGDPAYIHITNNCNVNLKHELRFVQDSVDYNTITFVQQNNSLRMFIDVQSQIYFTSKLGSKLIQIKTCLEENQFLCITKYFYLSDVFEIEDAHWYSHRDPFIKNKNVLTYMLVAFNEDINDFGYPFTPEQWENNPVFGDVLSLCTSEEDCYSMLVPDVPNDFTKCRFGGSTYLNYNLEFASGQRGQQDINCRKNYCSLYQFSRYVQSHLNTLNVDLNNQFVYLLDDNYSVLYDTGAGSWDGLQTPLTNIKVYGFSGHGTNVTQIPIGVLGAGKYKLYITHQGSDYNIYPIYYQGATPSIFYKLPYDGLASDVSNTYGVTFPNESNVQFKFLKTLNTAVYVANENAGRVAYNLYELDNYDNSLEGYTVFKYVPAENTIYFAPNKCFDANGPYDCRSKNKTPEYSSLQEIVEGVKLGNLCYLTSPYDNSETIYYQ